jgi:hypothetical protein
MFAEAHPKDNLDSHFLDTLERAHVGRAVDTRDWPMVGERAARPQRPDRLGRRR